MLSAVAVATSAAAQVSLSVAGSSDYRYRGGSLSDKRPTAALRLFYDHASGAYLGGSAVAVATQGHGPKLMGTIVYAGYAQRISPAVALDVGASHSQIDYYRFGRRAFDYSEVYLGLQTERASLRAHYSPDYFNSGVKTLYLDLTTTVRAGDDWRVSAHAGLLEPVGGRRAPGARGTRYDASLAVARTFGAAELSLTLSGVTPRASGAYLRGLESPAVTLGASYAF